MKDYLVVDVREPSEYSDNHFEGALNIPLSEIISGAKALGDTPKDASIILYCRSGARSGAAIDALRRLGFTNLQNGINQSTVEKMLNTA